MLELVRRLAGFDVSTLLSGESGVGKEVVAKILHDQSPRVSRPFVALNCAAIPENLVESILFGHIKGAFTGAHQDQEGVFEQAHGGVLFLDEVGELPLHTQPKLLRAIQEQKVCRVGGNKSIDVDVRLVSATNRDLDVMVSSGGFRQDLLYRLNSFQLSIPPLRERPLDLEALALHFSESPTCAGRVMQLSRDALRLLLAHDWPGNVRELENVISRAKVVADTDVICERHILLDACVSSLPTNYVGLEISPAVTTHAADSLATTKESAEWLAIQDALATTASKADAAKVLGISPRTLRHKIQKLNERGEQPQRKML
jgi:transcriptional regulator with PAS, ATPase and Fis domain